MSDSESGQAVWEVRFHAILKGQDGGPDVARDPELFKRMFPKVAKKWVFQKERGEKDGYLHYGGRLSLYKKKRKHELEGMLRGIKGFPFPDWLMQTTVTEHRKTAFYHMKEDTRVEGPWSDKDEEEYLAPEYYAPEAWYPFQQQIIDSIEIRDRRTINMVLDSRGNHGRTHFAMNLECRKMALVLPSLQDHKEICECVCDELMASEERDPKCVIMDLPRAMSKKALAGVFTALENIKNGKVVDRRYTYRKWFFRPPQVWVFSNRAPNLAYMSRDRWKLWRITDEYALEPVDYETGETEFNFEDNDEAIDTEGAVDFKGGYKS